MMTGIQNHLRPVTPTTWYPIVARCDDGLGQEFHYEKTYARQLEAVFCDRSQRYLDDIDMAMLVASAGG